jgi:hypothetical protein
MVSFTGLSVSKNQYHMILSALEHQVEVCEMFADETPAGEADAENARMILRAFVLIGTTQGVV